MKPRQWYEIKNVAADLAEVWIYEQIGQDWFGEGISAKEFVQELAALDVSAIDLHINSPGGQAFEGQAIYSALRAHKATVTTYVDGLAASIASVIALAGDRVVMAGNALFMVHHPAGCACGTAPELRQYADLLDKVSETIVGVYQAKTGRTIDEIDAAMVAETWFTAQEAADFGFVDEIAEPLKMAASAQLSELTAEQLRVLGYRHPDSVPAEGVTNAGRVLSSKNEQDLRDARDLIQGVIDQVDPSASQSGAPAVAETTDVEAAEAEPATVVTWVRGRPFTVRVARATPEGA